MPKRTTNSTPTRGSERTSFRGTVAQAWFVGWFLAIGVPMTLLAAKHWSPLPQPGQRTGVQRATGSGWNAVHVLVAECGCSRRLAKHLARRGPSDSVNESVLLVEPDPSMESSLAKSGWTVRVATPDEAARELGVEGGPFLFVFGPDGTPGYAGGHGPRPGAPDAWQDSDLIAAAVAGRRPSPLPVYGCGVSDRFTATRRLTTLGSLSSSTR
jgi:hypothetical protein